MVTIEQKDERISELTSELATLRSQKGPKLLNENVV